MSRLEDLPRVADETLAGLKADASLKHRILEKTLSVDFAPAQAEPARGRAFRPLPVFCGLLAALLVLALSLNTLRPVRPDAPGEINAFAAGGSEDRSVPALFPAGFEAASVVSLSVDNKKAVADPAALASLVQLLLDEAEPAAAADLSPVSRLSFVTASGDAFSFDACDPYLIGDGTWSCPAFFDALRALPAE